MFVCTCGLSGCTTNYYRKSADREVARLIAEKTPVVPNMDPHFTIEQTHSITETNALPKVEKPDDFLGPDGQTDVQASILSLDQALDIAVKHSPSYQDQKELIFLRALDLTLARHRYTPIFSGGAGATYESTAADVGKQIEVLTGGELVQQTQIVRERQHSINGSGNVGVDVLLRTGGRLATDFTTDFLRFLSGDPRWAASSRLGATLTQPLLRGAGYQVAMENLTQAERNLLYSLRSFARFRKEFSVQIASAYYQVLQNRDEARNAWLGYQNFKLNVEREKALAAEGQSTQTALGQLQQASLSTENAWVNAVRNYRQSLDAFKIRIGLPTDTRIVLDDREMKSLAILHPNISAMDAVKVALESRLDLQNVRNQFEDAARRTGIAKNGLLADLNLIVSASANTTQNRPLNFDFENARWTAGLDVNLPLDRKQERNQYRRSLIDYEQAGRALKLAVDNIKLDIFDGWRALDEAKRSFEISEIGVALSERRVEEQELLTQLGRGTARDLVDARKDLIDAQNRRTSALIRHTIARLQFWRDMGILFIKENGQWNEARIANNN